VRGHLVSDGVLLREGKQHSSLSWSVTDADATGTGRVGRSQSTKWKAASPLIGSPLFFALLRMLYWLLDLSRAVEEERQHVDLFLLYGLELAGVVAESFDDGRRHLLVEHSRLDCPR
jgi:hypothetical protein